MVPDLDALHEFARRYTADQQLLILFSRRFKRRPPQRGAFFVQRPAAGPRPRRHDLNRGISP